MKKLVLRTFVLVIILTSCSSNSDSNESNNNSITPPSWIQGIWLQTQSTDPLIISKFCKFTNNDFCVFASSTEICNAQSIQQAAQSGATTNIQQTISDDVYELSLTIQSQTTSYKFIKISSTKIEYVNPISGLPNLPLTRQ